MACPVLFGAPDEEPVQGGVRARPATAEHGVLAGQLQVQRRHPAQVRPLGGAHGAVPRQEVRTLHSLNHQFSLMLLYCVNPCEFHMLLPC